MGMRKGSLGAQWVVLPLRKEPGGHALWQAELALLLMPGPSVSSALPTALRLETGCWAPPAWAPGRGTSQLSAEERGQAGQDLLPLCRGRKGQRESGAGGQAQALHLQKLFHGTATVNIILTRHPSRAIVLHVVGLFRFRAEVSLLSST